MTIEWTVNNEIQLFHAMMGHKPVGINKHFQMFVIHNKLSESLNKEVSSRTIWEKLETLYDLAALDDCDKLPLPTQEITEFTLPSDYLQNLHPSAIESSSVTTAPLPLSLPDTPSHSSKVLYAVTPTSIASSTNLSSQATSSTVGGLPHVTPLQQNSSSNNTPLTDFDNSSSQLDSVTLSGTSISNSPSNSSLSHRYSIPSNVKQGISSNSSSSTPQHSSGGSSDQHTPKHRTYSRIIAESREDATSPSSSIRRGGSNRGSDDMISSADDSITPRRLKRGRDSKSGSPSTAVTPSLSKRRKV